MSVLDGPREEWRRILHEGQPKWVKPDGERLLLGDGRQVAEAPAPAHKVGHQPTDTDAVRRVALGSDWVRSDAR
jgi:hypothetical protein